MVHSTYTYTVDFTFYHIPMIAVCKAVMKGLGMGTNQLVTFRATLHEDCYVA
jgi:hypothetical protein